MTRSFMFIAGEVSGDERAAQLIEALKTQAPEHGLEKCAFFGAGGPAMREAGVDLAIDMTRHTVLGLWAVIGNYFQQKKLFNQLLQLARERRPDVIVLVDYGVFNRLFAQAIRKQIRSSSELEKALDSVPDDRPEQGKNSGLPRPLGGEGRGEGESSDNLQAPTQSASPALPSTWSPKIVFYVSPQVWASRPKRALQLERDIDLMLSIIPFEKEWYAKKTPKLRVEWVGHPLVDKHQDALHRDRQKPAPGKQPLVLLLPGSRKGELKRHLPVMLPAANRLAQELGAKLLMVLPSEEKRAYAQPFLAEAPDLEIRIGGLADAMQEADLAIASSGTVTHELALFQVPTVVIYKVNGLFFEIGKRVATVKYLALPNLIADEVVYPECLQGDATPEKIFAEALAILTDDARRSAMKEKLQKVAKALGEPGAANRAAKHVLELLA